VFLLASMKVLRNFIYPFFCQMRSVGLFIRSQNFVDFYFERKNSANYAYIKCGTIISGFFLSCLRFLFSFDLDPTFSG
jgi:hypothetical protein